MRNEPGKSPQDIGEGSLRNLRILTVGFASLPGSPTLEHAAVSCAAEHHNFRLLRPQPVGWFLALRSSEVLVSVGVLAAQDGEKNLSRQDLGRRRGKNVLR